MSTSENLGMLARDFDVSVLMQILMEILNIFVFRLIASNCSLAHFLLKFFFINLSTSLGDLRSKAQVKTFLAKDFVLLIRKKVLKIKLEYV